MALHGGIDLGGTKIQAAVVADGGEVKGQARRPTPAEGGPEAVAEAMAAALEEAAGAADVDPGALEAVGVGSPGAVDGERGTVSEVANIPGWEGAFGLRDALSQRLGGTRVAIGNDVQVATDAEVALGAGKPYGSLLGVFWGTGVGGGLVLDGRPWLGRSSAGEIGHVVVKLGGRRCGCGRQGCMEAYAGRGAMEREARRRHDDGAHTELFKIMHKRERERLSSGIWSRALEAGDTLAAEIMAEAVAALGAGIASAQNLLDVEAVVIGGGMGLRFGEEYVAKIRAAMAPHLFVDSDPPAVVLAALGDFGGAIGASLLVSAPQPA